MFVHWSPRSHAERLDSARWRTERIPATEKQRRWMFCVPMQVDGLNGVDLVAGAKNPGAAVGWLQCPRQPRQLAAWRWHEIYRAGWIMSLVAIDMDIDGDTDILLSDRKGVQRGCCWLENPGTAAVLDRLWKVHRIGGQGQEVMFLSPCDLDRDGKLDVVVAVRGGDLLYLRCERLRPLTWRTWPIRMPPGTGTGKAVAAGDLDLDNRVDLVVSCEHARGRSGVFWLSWRRSVSDPVWDAHEISGRAEGTKYDLIRLIDLDEDSDLDVLTCEERDNLGVIWYENPTR
ncbi:MAG TPA: VCBS repeat-containing protein [Planctomycetaceae bacterium]|nr:VCBS repeat-containing protein [Planctomycetaceae bacterium]